MIRCLLHHLQADHRVTCSKTSCVLQCCYKMYNIHCFLIYSVVTMSKTICVSSFCILKLFKTLSLKPKLQHINICWPLLFMCVGTPKETDNITTGTGSSQDLYTITHPSTAGYSEHLYCQHTQQIARANRN
jgi:hypothetical protein